MQFHAFEPGIEVNGQTVYAIVDGFTVYKQLPSKVLLDEGIGTPAGDGLVRIEPEAWYSQQAWLRAFEKIAQTTGSNVLFNIGLRIPRNAIFPPWVQDVDTAVQSIDVAYHLNHRRAGQVMFNPESKAMLEGIGHYGYQRPDPGANRIVSVCENPYPCTFDVGIVTAMARRFAPLARVDHAGGPCRQKGASACTYVVTW